MVFISVGTQKQPFTRLFDLVLNSEKLKNEKIIAQCGYTKVEDKRIDSFDFTSFENIEKYFEEADLVICHGGVGTIFSALKKHKKVIAIPRLSKYGEHINDHQIEICEELQNEGYILYYDESNDTLDELISKAENTMFNEYKSDKSYLDILRKEI